MKFWYVIRDFLRGPRIKDQLDEVQFTLDLTPDMELPENKNPFVRYVQNREQRHVEG